MSAAITTLLALQFAAPVLMLVWLAAKPPSSRIGIALLAAAASACLLAVALTGLWTFMPWWTPHALATILLALTVWRGMASRPWLPAGAGARIGAMACIVVGSLALLQSYAAFKGRHRASGPVADIASPLAEGTYLVVNGGSDASINAHIKTMSPDEPRYRPWRGQSYGIDLIRVGASGLRSQALMPTAPSDYIGFGSMILAPCNGTIMRAVDGIKDNEVPQTNRDQMAGNHVIVRCNGYDIVLAHLRQSSIVVSESDNVVAGQPLGELGNSGNSDEPHLHLHAQQIAPLDGTFSAEPVPLRIDGHFPVRNDRLYGRSRRQ